LLSESSTIGDLFHSLLGYADHPTVLQGVAWVTYVLLALAGFVYVSRRPRRASAHPSSRSALDGATGS
jgi:high-affinity Fe2+/Pb2+ permease